MMVLLGPWATLMSSTPLATVFLCFVRRSLREQDVGVSAVCM